MVVPDRKPAVQSSTFLSFAVRFQDSHIAAFKLL